MSEPYRSGPIPPGVQMGYAPPPKPPLPQRARNGALIAGAVSFSVLSLGWSLLFGAVLIAVIGGMFLWIGQLVDGASNDPSEEWFFDILASFDVGVLVPLLVVAGIVGLLLMTLALFLSRWILGAHQVNQPWPVTWAAAGVAVVASWIIGGVLSAMVQVAAPFAYLTPDPISVGIGVSVVSGLGAIVVTAAIGMLSWWWMAHLMRSREPRAAVPGGG